MPRRLLASLAVLASVVPLFLGSISADETSTPQQPIRSNPPRVYALTGAKVVVSAGQTLDDATIVVRDGRIEAVGAGIGAGDVFEGQRRFPIMVRLPDDRRADLEAMKALWVTAPNGSRIPLRELADIRIVEGPAQISREQASRRIVIEANVVGRDLVGTVEEARAAVSSLVPLPPGYYVTWGGQFENQQRAMTRLAIVVPVSVFLIFILLFDAFKSLKSSLLILGNVPFALIGGILGLLVTHIPLSVSAAIGFIALFGQAVLNGVVMVSHFNQLRDEGKTALAAATEGAITRLRTVLMTAMLAMLGLFPMAISRAIVERHRGRIGLRSRDGGGSVFWFELPLGEAVASVSAMSRPVTPVVAAGGGRHDG